MSLSRVRERVSGAFWPLPTLIVVVMAGVCLGLLRVDRLISADADVEFAFAGGPDSARSLLSTISSSMITFTGLVFSVTLVVLTLASSQYSPRVLRAFLRDRLTQAALGVFVATFVYALIALRAVRGTDNSLVDEAFVPGVTMTVAFLLVLVAVGVFVQYINHVVQLIRAENIIGRIAGETREAIDRVHPAPDRDGARDGALRPAGPPRGATPAPVPGPTRTLVARRPGVVTAVDADALVERAVEADVAFTVVRAVGEFVPEGAPLIEVTGQGAAAVDGDVVRRAVPLDRDRSMTADVAFGFRQLVDIAERALSPGVNDPTTAVQCLDQIHDLLRRLATRPLGDGTHRDATGRVRLRVPTASWVSYVDLGCDEIRHWGAGSLQIHRRLRTMLDDLLTVVGGDRRTPLQHQLTLLDARRELDLPESEHAAALAHPGPSRGRPDPIRPNQAGHAAGS